MKYSTSYLNVILEKLIESQLFELALHRKLAKQKINSYSDQIATHVVKCLIFKDAREFNHWIKELNSWLYSINMIRLRQKQKKFSADEYMKMLWEPYFETPSEVKDYVSSVVKQNKELVRGEIQFDERQVYNRIRNLYLVDVCEPIATNSFDDLKKQCFNQ